MLLFLSPILWWVDKAHTEVLTFATISLALGWLDEKPRRSLLCLGLGAAQNPPLGALLGLVALRTLSCPAWRKDRRLWAALVSAGVLAALNPVYYQLRVGRPLPLLAATHGGWPTLSELTAVATDLNLGLVPAAPLFVLALLSGVWLLLRRAPRRLLAADVVLAGVTAVAFLLIFAQVTNINHGGTPGMSRYALWLVPLTIPVFKHLATATGAHPPRWFVALALASGAWSMVTFHPAKPEEYLRPNWLADWVWTRWPWLDNPHPEVFVERVRGTEGDWWVPTATPGCEKVLLVGRGPGVSTWPVPCPPEDLPARCMEPGALCYANRRGRGYTFAPLPWPSLYRYKFAREAVWPIAETATARRLLSRIRWWELTTGDRAGGRHQVRAAYDVGQVYEYAGDDRLFVYVRPIGAAARLTLRTASPMVGEVLEPATGAHVASVRYEGPSGEAWTLELPGPRSSAIVVLYRAR